MKTRINIICIVIMAVIIASAVYHICAVGVGFGAGFKVGMTSCESDNTLMPFSSVVVVSSDKGDFFNCSNPIKLSDGEDGAITPILGIVHLPKDSNNLVYSPLLSILTLIPSLIYCVVAIWTIVLFVKFINNVNHDKIFEVRNVAYLKKMGWLLFTGGCALLLGGILTIYIVKPIKHVAPGYEFSAYWNIPWTPVLLGLLSLLMAEIWNRAIKMKELQDLTI